MQCRAKAKQSGQRCKRHTIPGGKTCVIHGSGTQAAKTAAVERLAALADPAVAELARVMRKGSPDSARLAAALGVLDRTGHGRSSTVHVPGLPALAEQLAALSADDKIKLATMLDEADE